MGHRKPSCAASSGAGTQYPKHDLDRFHMSSVYFSSPSFVARSDESLHRNPPRTRHAGTGDTARDRGGKLIIITKAANH
ncbi:hypothetical protein AMELA_G00234180 [Ameiurus melas]|uniref:Uncharacterized protein n=1 Tax=Ameiurus melas TaxID=219545 RepID=A0A7J5ZXQ1_AMEME|nr:hypothetical protein AMELA_G00234180 [Ameiurus melas]